MEVLIANNSAPVRKNLKDVLGRLVVWIIGISFLTIFSAVVLTRCALVISLIFHNRFAPP